MVLFNTIRLAVFGTVLLLSLIPLGIAANFTRPTVTTGFTFPGFTVAVVVITMVLVVGCLLVDRLRRGAVISLVATELGWVGLLWVLWLAASAHATNSLAGVDFTNCAAYDTFRSFCHQYQTLQAFSWIIWLILLGYWGTLLTFAIIANSRGNKRAFLTPTTELGHSVAHGGNAAGEPKIPPPANPNYPQHTGGTVYPQTTGPSVHGGYPQPQYAPPPQQPGYPPQPAPGGYQAPYSPPPHPQAPYSPAPGTIQV